MRRFKHINLFKVKLYKYLLLWMREKICRKFTKQLEEVHNKNLEKINFVSYTRREDKFFEIKV